MQTAGVGALRLKTPAYAKKSIDSERERLRERVERSDSVLRDVIVAEVQRIIRRENTKGEGVRLATMHRVKGLEFPRMLIAGVQAGSVPLERSKRESGKPLSRWNLVAPERVLHRTWAEVA